MPDMAIDSGTLYYEIDGAAGAPWLVLSNSLGTTLEMWNPQMDVLRRHFRVLRYDTRGHGRSPATPGPYTIDRLGADLLALMDGLGIARADVCGLSMGGMTAMWLGIHHPQRVGKLALCNTAALIGPPDVWNARIGKVRQEGMAAITSAVIDRWFTPRFQHAAPQQVEQVRSMLLGMSPDGYAACCAAVRDMDLRLSLPRLQAPVLVIAGTHDAATAPAEGRAIAQSVPDARYIELDAAHLSNWEQSAAFTAALADFLHARAG